jgi:hypothetical protein
MQARTCTCLAAVALALGLPLLARDDTSDEPKPDEPVRVEKDLFDPPIRLAAADGMIDSGASWGHCGPWIADVDGDGIKDLIVGDFSGFFRFYRNEGTNQKPRYAKAVNLQAGGVDAKVPIY